MDRELLTPEYEEARLTRLIEALSGLSGSTEWRALEELHFTKEQERIERLLKSEASKPILDSPAIYRLQGELLGAKRYADIRAWVAHLSKQLSTLKNI